MNLEKATRKELIAEIKHNIREQEEYVQEIEKLQDELKDVSKSRDNNFAHAYELKQILKQIKKLATERNYLDYGECLDDILDLINT